MCNSEIAIEQHEDFKAHQDAGLVYTHDEDNPWIGMDSAWRKFESYLEGIINDDHDCNDDCGCR